ncbi:hypothetical protein RhiirA5_442886, partial [Rhizophagus irregularis]
DSEEILGGYNPLKWESSNTWGKTNISFIFSFKNKNNFKDAILSIIKDVNKAFNYHSTHGPCFGKDLIMYSTSNSSTDMDIDKTSYYSRGYYEKSIRKEGEFPMEDYEIFQIIKR